ncbi:MAG: CoA pyrophosphatase [Pseudomonadota bacterium]
MALHLLVMAITRADIDAALALPPLGPRSDFDLVPELDPRRRSEAGPMPERPASVLCPLVERGGALNVVLTVRAAHLKHHAGQISFPGGKVEGEDAGPLAAALREADEEIGLPPAEVRVLGAMDGYLTSTGFRVSPFVGLVPPDWRAVPDPSEVAEVFECPLDFVMDPANRRRDHRLWRGGRRYFYAMPWGEYYIWGATAGMLKSLSDRMVRLGVVAPSAETDAAAPPAGIGAPAPAPAPAMTSAAIPPAAPAAIPSTNPTAAAAATATPAATPPGRMAAAPAGRRGALAEGESGRPAGAR